MVARQFFSQYSLTASNSITFPKQSGSTAAVVQKVAEGVEIPLDVTAYSQVNVVPYKIAHGFIITKEMIEDSLIPVQQDQLIRSALRFANKIDKDCIAAIGAGTGSSVTASGKSLAFDGTEFVISGSGGPGVGTYISEKYQQKQQLCKCGKVFHHIGRCVNHIPWNKGLTKEMDKRVAKNSIYTENRKNKVRLNVKKAREKRKEYEKDPIYQQFMSEIRKNMWMNNDYREKQTKSHIGKFTYRETNIEKLFEIGLKNKNINNFEHPYYLYNKPTKRLLVGDFVFEKEKIWIECDGDYWHSNPKYFNCDLLDIRQKRNFERDQEKNKILESNGWTLLRFWEDEINTNIESCLNSVEIFLKK